MEDDCIIYEVWGGQICMNPDHTDCDSDTA